MLYSNSFTVTIGAFIFVLGLIGGFVLEKSINKNDLESKQFEQHIDNVQVIKACKDTIILLYPTNNQ